MSTSFVKKLNTGPQLYKSRKGVKAFPNQQYSISSGNPSLDALIGGGFPIGSMILLLEDSFSHYYDHFLKTFLGEGIVNEHKVMIVDPDVIRDRDYWLKFLPAVFKLKDTTSSSTGSSTQSSSESNSSSDEKANTNQQQQLKVAWRYNNLLEEGKGQMGIGDGEISYKFDNSREMGKAFANSMSHQLLKDELTVHLKYQADASNYIDLWEQICEQVQNHLETETDDRIFRILLPNFNLFLKNDHEDTNLAKKSEKDLIRFLRNLKTLIRSTNGVVFISVDEDLLSKFLVNNLIFLADSVFKLTSFKDHQEMQIGEYDGTIKFLKQPKLHGLISTLSDFDIYALKLKGKQGILVEKIHLEPEEDRAGQDENLQQKGSSIKKIIKKGGQSQQLGATASVQCNPTKSHQLDF